MRRPFRGGYDKVVGFRAEAVARAEDGGGRRQPELVLMLLEMHRFGVDVFDDDRARHLHELSNQATPAWRDQGGRIETPHRQIPSIIAKMIKRATLNS